MEYYNEKITHYTHRFVVVDQIATLLFFFLMEISHNNNRFYRRMRYNNNNNNIWLKHQYLKHKYQSMVQQK